MLPGLMAKDDFASLMEGLTSDSSKRVARRLRRGEVVEGTIVQISADSVFIDVGATSEARVDRGELVDRTGVLTARVGDKIRGTVVDARPESLTVAIALGREGAVDVAALQAARDAGSVVSGVVKQAVKAGLEIEIGGVRAFCPASQVEIGRAPDLEVYVGQTLEFRVLEVRDGGKSVVVSRRAELEARRAEAARDLLERLVPGAEVDGTVHSVTRHGAVIDLGGVEGFVHISEIAHQRIAKVEDAVEVGAAVRVQVLGIEESPKGLRVRLSMKALLAAPRATSQQADEVLVGKVSRHTNSGVIVETAAGEGLVPARDLGLPPGADHRRAFPVGREVTVVVVSRDGAGKVRFSVSGVAAVEERRNYREFAAAGKGRGSSSGLGSLGDIMREKLGLPPATAGDTETGAAVAAPPTAPDSAPEPRRDGDPRRDRDLGVVRRKK